MAGLFSTVTNRLWDSTILYSFDRSGFIRHAKEFNTSDLNADLTGKIILVTGANSGLGKETARALAKRKATVYLLCRNPQRGTETEEVLRKQTQNNQIFYANIDLSNLDSVQHFLRTFAVPKIDVLIHNAGVLPRKLQHTEQGHELTYATNILGPHLLTKGLWPKLTNGRMILVSSGGMYPVPFNLAELVEPQAPFDGVKAYAQTKRTQVILNKMWAQKGQKQNTIVHAMHPGWAATPGVQNSLPGFWKSMKNRLRTAEEGADTIIWLASAKRAGASTGQFWFDRKVQKEHIFPWTKEKGFERNELWEHLENSVQQFTSTAQPL